MAWAALLARSAWLGQLMPKNITVTRNKTKGLAKAIASLAENRVYAGVPATTAGRKEGGALNNAEIMFIHENGAPEANIPARPVVHPAIKKATPAIVGAFKATGKLALNGDSSAVFKGLNAVGLIAQNAMRERITDGPFVPLSPKTIAARARKRGTKRRKGEQQYLDLLAGGATPAEAQEAAGIKALIDTGQLRRALTYVIRKISWGGRTRNLA